MHPGCSHGHNNASASSQSGMTAPSGAAGCAWPGSFQRRIPVWGGPHSDTGTCSHTRCSGVHVVIQSCLTSTWVVADHLATESIEEVSTIRDPFTVVSSAGSSFSKSLTPRMQYVWALRPSFVEVEEERWSSLWGCWSRMVTHRKNRF
ncbi:hypothetical protein CEXT_67191 [Caerostris extrusa]|uniref:Uncharacterized protein n=1 Tax=Caerostris extrusa TaxID=172846 RepID=A0AAV4Y0U1_CAEEX|nr:hypothetical protein CEXT_67191 [Caerostris extrusa]